MRQSKWDRCTIGDLRIDGLILKDAEPKSEYCYAANVRDIDFEAMRELNAANFQPYEEAVEAALERDSRNRDRLRSEEDYVKWQTSFSTYAVVTPDGEWHAPGKDDFRGSLAKMSDEEWAWILGYYERFIKPALDNNWYLVIVECEI